MSELIRFGVSVEESLMTAFDKLIAEKGYGSRSEALRDLMRDALVSSKLEGDSGKDAAETLGSLTLVYDHHVPELTKQMTDLQHDYDGLVVSVMHIHVSHEDCMEVIALRGAGRDIHELANALLSLKGVKHGKLFTTVPPKHMHPHPHKHKSPRRSR